MDMVVIVFTQSDRFPVVRSRKFLKSFTKQQQTKRKTGITFVR